MPAENSARGRVFRKRLAEDCLLGGELHPSIAQRLHRVRELPVGAVANLHGVERDSAGVWLVWQFIEGLTLEQFMQLEHPDRKPDALARELELAVAAMHAHGIVHGAIHARNVIVDPRGRVRLTHVSPLLYSDPAEDDRAVAELVALLRPKQEQSSPEEGNDRAVERGVRRSAYLSAAAALFGGALMFLAILWYIHR